MWWSTACICTCLAVTTPLVHADDSPADTERPARTATQAVKAHADDRASGQAGRTAPAAPTAPSTSTAPATPSTAPSHRSGSWEQQTEQSGDDSSPKAPLFHLTLNSGSLGWTALEPDEPDEIGIATAADIPTADGALSSYIDLNLWARRGQLRLSGYGNELAIACDGRARWMRLRLAAGHDRVFQIRFNGHLTLQRKPVLDARLSIRVPGHEFAFDLPSLRVDARWRSGGVKTEIFVPVIRGGF